MLPACHGWEQPGVREQAAGLRLEPLTGFTCPVVEDLRLCWLAQREMSEGGLCPGEVEKLPDLAHGL